MIKGKAKLMFGTGDIAGAVCEHKTDKNQVGLFFKNVEAGEIGRRAEGAIEKASDCEVGMIFTDVKSLDVIIGSLQTVKEIMLKNMKEENHDRSES